MKAKAALLILILVIFGLGVALLVLNQQATKEKKEAEKTIISLTNDLVETQVRLKDAQTVNRTLETNLETTKFEYSNKLSLSESNLTATASQLTKAQDDLKAAADAAAAQAAAIVEKDKKITDLENQNQALDKAAADLRASITNLETQIADTQHKLGTSEGERAFLVKELKRLQAEKADLEKKFNDLAVLREQVRKIKQELAISRRLDWARRGIYSAATLKGAERMMHRPETLPPSTNNVLNVELRQDGSVKITTNAPAAR